MDGSSKAFKFSHGEAVHTLNYQMDNQLDSGYF